MSEIKSISNLAYFSLIIITFLLGLGLAIQNGFFGWEQGASPAKAVLTATMFFLGDAVLVVLAHFMMPRFITISLAWIVLIGLCALSMFAASAFLVGQEHSVTISHNQQQIQNVDKFNEANNQLIASYKNEIRLLEQHIDSLPKGWPKNRALSMSKISDANNKIAEVSKQLIPYPTTDMETTPENAIYVWIAKATNTSQQTVSLFVRLSWAIIFVLASIVMGGLMKILKDVKLKNTPPTTPSKKKKMHNEKDMNKKQTPVPDNIVSLDTVPKNTLTTKPETVPSPLDIWDESRYTKTLNAVLSGAVRPSVRGVKSLGIGTDQAAEILRTMLDDGYLVRAGQGYKLRKAA
jgi:hypothetical protein